jgi:hypothetical protein
MIINRDPQRSEAWYESRRGLPTCSRFSSILTAVKETPSSGQNTLINELIAESIQPPAEGIIDRRVMTQEMEYGMRLEAEARCSFELEHAGGAVVSEVGFVLHDSGLFGGSPDALVGGESGVEIKCPNLATHIGYVRAGVLPSEYKCQVHGYMIVTGRNEWNFYSYARGVAPFHLIVSRDAFTGKLESALYDFCKRYNAVRSLFNLPEIGREQDHDNHLPAAKADRRNPGPKAPSSGGTI